ncbi:type IV pilin protein [Romboutsia ilealis]|uniref:type IV pilin protein n=1 Tax=Romboutsia ilealis TaxID=1115758 RepID=UPI0025748B7A|nr:prepilin-type N-terminal cleavage/methylation domain-containing protein [Romboutsia ilealis]
MLNKKKNNKGFTLVELLVVIAIIGILAVVAVPALFKNIEKGKVADLEADISAIRSAVLSYYADNSEYPDSEDDLEDDLEGLSKPFEAIYEFEGDVSQGLTLNITLTSNLSQSGIDKLKSDLGDKATDVQANSITIQLIEIDKVQNK